MSDLVGNTKYRFSQNEARILDVRFFSFARGGWGFSPRESLRRHYIYIYFQVMAASREMFRGGIKNGRYWYKLDFVNFDIKLSLVIILLRFWQISRKLVVNYT